MKQLSNKERIYRYKIIAENHFKKDEQRYLDFYVAENKAHSINLTYKQLYFEYGLLRSMLVKYGFSKLGNALKNVGISCTQATSAFKNLTASLSKFNNNNLKR